MMCSFRSTRLRSLAAAGLVALGCLPGLGACGGSSPATPSPAPAPTSAPAPSPGAPIGQNSNGTPVTPSIASTADNSVELVIDGGPPELVAGSTPYLNAPFVSVTICEPGSTTKCQTIDHIMVDTGSVGLRLFADTLGTQVSPPTMGVAATQEDVRVCYNYVSGYTWGAMAKVDLTLGSAKIADFPIMLVGDGRAGTAPAACAQGRNLSSGVASRMKGIMGVGYSTSDCGRQCETAARSRYYACTPGTSDCQRLAVPESEQIANPVRAIGPDVNGVVLQFPAASGDMKELRGRMYFGIGTHPDNTPKPDERVYPLDADGFFSSTVNGRTYRHSAVDSGSNGMYYPSSLPACKNGVFYCPPAATTETAIITGADGTAASLTFLVENADRALASGLPVLPGLAGNAGAQPDESNTYVLWGLPFYLGRTTYLLFEGAKYQDTTGPASIF